MRKIRLILITLCLLLLPITVTKAEVVTKERTAENNYGVSKKWDMTQESIEYAKKTPYVDASKKIYDFSDILTDEEEQELYNRIMPLIKEYNMEIIILTYNYPYSKDSDNSYFVSDFYDFNDFGLDFEKYDGVVLFRNTYSLDPYYDMLSFGDAQLQYYDTRMSSILDALYNDIHAGRYLAGFNKWLDKVEYYHSQSGLDNYTVDDMGYLRKKFSPHFGICAVIAGIITLIFVMVNVKKNKMVKTATQAAAYLNQETFKLLEKNDRLISSHVTSYTESSSSSGGGGHSSFGGHSGGGFSSGGGRHG
ncbi:MAG: TPM domain-containing protein [Bacilli bacterium]|nr:TPM domain-containing protein [Bacilli bacterium]